MAEEINGTVFGTPEELGVKAATPEEVGASKVSAAEFRERMVEAHRRGQAKMMSEKFWRTRY